MGIRAAAKCVKEVGDNTYRKTSRPLLAGCTVEVIHTILENIEDESESGSGCQYAE